MEGARKRELVGGLGGHTAMRLERSVGRVYSNFPSPGRNENKIEK